MEFSNILLQCPDQIIIAKPNSRDTHYLKKISKISTMFQLENRSKIQVWWALYAINNILKGTSNAKSELVLLEWTPRLCLCFVLYYMCLVNTFIIALYGVMNYSLHMSNYSRPSVIRTLMARLPRLFQTRS